MKRSKSVRDFDFYIDEYMYNCQSRKLRKKTLQAYEQTLRLFERWCMDEMGITSPEEVREATFRRYICDMQERGKYTFFSVEESAIGYTPNKRRDFAHPLSVTSNNNYIRNLKAFFAWYAKYAGQLNPVTEVKELKNERKAREYLEDEEIEKLMKSFDRGLYKEHRDSMIIMLLMDTGMRLGECLKIKIEDVDMAERTICLPAENTKGRQTRFVFFSVTTARRPQFSMLFQKLQEGDTLVVTKLDRFARTAIDGVSAVRELFNRGVRVHILNMGLVENTLTGNLILTVMLAFAEYERGMIVERTQTGKAVARQDPNFREGRPKKYTKCQLQHAMELLDSGKSYKQVEAMTGISKSTLIRARK